MQQEERKQSSKPQVILDTTQESATQEFHYLDWASTAPMRPESYQAMIAALRPGLSGLQMGGGNANALYTAGRNAFKLLEQARRTMAGLLNARGDEIIFTSGATESNNAALCGIVDALMLEQEQHGFSEECEDHDHDHECVPNIVISSIEHDAVLEVARQLFTWGADVTLVDPDKTGHITPEALREACNHHTILVSIMAVNNEMGAVMDIPALAAVAHEYGALFHTDATQAIGKIPVSVKEWGIDALSCSSHKIGGPKGCGLLYLKAHTPFSAQIVGGGQEFNKRSGTQNVAGVLGFEAALQSAIASQQTEAARLVELRDYCYQQLLEIPEISATVPVEAGSCLYAPHIVSVMVKGFESETLIMQLDARGIAVSGGSACSSHSLEPSHVMRALGVSRDAALTALRISLGYLTTSDDIDALVCALRDIVYHQ